MHQAPACCSLLLPQTCRVADRWRATACLRQCFAALALLPAAQLGVEMLADVLALLPDSVQQLPQHAAWQGQCMEVVCSQAATAGAALLPVLLQLFGDVHALLTSPGLLQQFKNLPFAAVSAWAGSGELTVDSENSVAVALGVWTAGRQGKKSSKAQLRELSGLLRVCT